MARSEYFHLIAIVAHQLGRTRFEEDGKCISYTSHTVNKAEQDCIVICKGRSWVGEEIEHGEIHHRLDDRIKMVNCILSKKVGQAAHAGGPFSPVL